MATHTTRRVGSTPTVVESDASFARILKRRGPAVETTTSYRRHESHELTWHRKAEGVEVIAHVPTTDGRTTANPAVRSSDASSHSTTAASVNQVKQALTVDSNFVGRLADDVMRRIERTVRIDRARRGI